MASKKGTAKGTFTPKNPEKYQGTYPITYRSSWELSVMMRFDDHPYVVAWGSESMGNKTFQIPYYNPFAKRWTVYIPDFWAIYYDQHGNKHAELMEVKPLKETPGYQPISERTGKPLKLSEATKMTQAINAVKWAAAMEWCKKNGFQFRVVTEETLYKNGRRS